MSQSSKLACVAPSALFDLTDRVCLLTGATGYLGRYMVAALVGAGAIVYLAGRSQEKLSDLAEVLNGGKGRAIALPFDVTDQAAIVAAVARIAHEQGQLDVLVNNAYSGAAGAFGTKTGTDFREAYNIGVVSVVELVQASLNLLKAGGTQRSSPSIINIASMYGIVSPDPRIYGDSGHDNPPSYGAMKAALIQYTRYAATNLAKEGIRVNAISPGAFPPASVAEKMPDLWCQLNKKQPMARVGRPEELQGAVIYLASNASSYVTGTNLVVDGGWTAW